MEKYPDIIMGMGEIELEPEIDLQKKSKNYLLF